MYRVTMFKDLPLHPNTQVVFAGHIHTPMSQERADGKIFINPGAVGRTSAKKDNLERDIYVVMLEYDLEGNTYNIEYIPLKTALPADQVFRLEEIKEEKAERQELKDFVKQTASFQSGSWSYTSLEDKIEAIKEFGKQREVEDEVVEIAVNAMIKYSSNTKKTEA